MKMKTKQRISRVFLYALVAILVVFSLFPFFYGLSASLRTSSEFYQYAYPFSIKTLLPVEPTLEAYGRLFIDNEFMIPIINTLIVVGVVIIVGNIVNSVAAFAFAMFDFPFKKIIFALVVVSFMVPFEAIALPLYQVADKLSLIETRSGIILPGIANGMVLFLFVQFFRDIPASFIEAARVDGATWPQIFAKILVPLSKTVFITASLMTFMNQWNSYLWPLLVARGKDIRTVQIALSSFQMERSTDWAALYAGSMVSALIPVFMFLPFQKYFVQGISSSGVKG